jgi:hypothetical protein
LLERIVVALAPAEAVAEVLVVLVVGIGFLGVDVATGICLVVGTQAARGCGQDARSATVACKVALLEDFDKGVFAVALYRAGIAHAGGCPGIRRAFGGWVAGQAGENVLP